jgi:hypothetical protein
MSTITISGDLHQQVNLASENLPQRTGGNAMHRLTVEESTDQVWSLAAFVGTACSDLKPDLQMSGPALVQAFVLWGPTARELNVKEKKGGGKGEDQVWRICRHLGITPASAKSHPSAAGDSRNPDVLLIDDLGLGFRNDPGLWPQALKDGGEPNSIILKCGAPLVRSNLWEHLLKHHADRLTVVVPIHLLRARGARFRLRCRGT